MKKSRGNSGLPQKYHSNQRVEGTGSSAGLPSDYSPPTQGVRGVRDRNLSSLFDYQLTVRPKVELTRYQMSMLLSVISFEIVQNGIDFVSWLTLEYLFSRLLGSKKVWEIRDNKERLSLTLANIILLTSQNSWLSLGERTSLPKEILDYIFNNHLVLSQRTYESRSDYWWPEKFIEVRAVPLDVALERESHSIRYSSYCKGYGESSRMGPRLKTRPSAELDGETEDRPEVVIPLVEISNFLLLNMLELRRKFEKKR